MLTPEQKSAVISWIEDGAGLNDIQRKLKDELGVSMTYMDVRFLVLDIGAAIKEKPEPAKPAEPVADAGAGVLPSPATADAEPYDELSPNTQHSTLNSDVTEPSVSVTLDKVVRAGALASGTVTFSGGVVGNWMLDRMGRLSLTKISDPDYQPTQEEIMAFQDELQRLASGL